ncbi:unnamed protein product, partial [Allacma fusca]
MPYVNCDARDIVKIGSPKGSSNKSVDHEREKWASCFRNLYKRDSGNETFLEEIFEGSFYCSSCVEEFEKLDDLLSQLENLRLQLDLIKLNYKTKLTRTLDNGKKRNNCEDGFAGQWKKREAVFE